MIAEQSVPDSTDWRGLCPVPKTHRRLSEAHLLWHQALDNYQEPAAFRANLNATIEALRNVTFVLQNEKAAFPDFEGWYGPWQARLKADVTAKWLHDARTTVVHQGELGSHSTAEVRLVTWKDEVIATLSVPVETPPVVILQNRQIRDLLDKIPGNAAYLKDAAIAIERRWSTAGLGESELLEGLARVYGLLSDIVLDAHLHLKRSDCIPDEHDHSDFRSAYHRTGTLECMAAGRERRTQVFKVSTEEELSPAETMVSEPYDAGDVMEAAKRYGLEKTGPWAAWEKLDPVRFAEKVLYQAKRILRQDKNHQRMMFIRDGRGEWHMRSLLARDRTEKHLVMRTVAQFVESKGCDAIVEVGEMWTAPATSVPDLDGDKIQSAKGRGELLFVTVATREGIFRTYTTPFTRGPLGGIKLGDTNQSDSRFALYYLEPILEVWRRQGSVRAPEGKLLRRVWEPDALDICFCGGPERFGECCRAHLPLNPRPQAVREEIAEAINAGKFDRAEELAKAALAQYVIWIKQHTAVTMHVAQDLHQQLVDIDVLALEAQVRQLQDCLEASGEGQLFITKVRYLAGIIGVPRLSMRLVALASRWLSNSGRIEEAILELGDLGDLDKIGLDKFEDALALLTIADLCDLSAMRKEQVLRRAAVVAACTEEELFAKFALTHHMMSTKKLDEALRIVDSIIAESRSKEGSVEAPAEALLLRWKITKSENDLRSFKAAIESSRGLPRRRCSAMLIDGGLYADAEQLLREDMDAGDLVAKLLVVDARMRSGKTDSARDLFLTIGQEQIQHESRYLYAVISAQLALFCKDERIRKLAILSIRALPASRAIDEDVQSLFRGVQGKDFTSAAPSG